MPLTAMQGVPSTFAGLGWEPPESEGPSYAKSEGPSVFEQWFGSGKSESANPIQDLFKQGIKDQERVNKDRERLLKERKKLADEQSKRLNKEREKLLKEKRKLKEKALRKASESSSDAGEYSSEGVAGLGAEDDVIWAKAKTWLIVGGAAVAIWYILKQK
jgi:hypothetical protein